jgi:hypothetical protein
MPPDPQFVEPPAPRISPTSSSSLETCDLRLKSTPAPDDDAVLARIIDDPILMNLRLDGLVFSGMMHLLFTGRIISRIIHEPVIAIP